MKELQEKISVTSVAIKNTKKKHKKEVYQLNSKLQFLRTEDQLLNQKIAETTTQLNSLQQKLAARVFNNSEDKDKGRVIGKVSPSYLLLKK